jgi:hypothetical protein
MPLQQPWMLPAVVMQTALGIAFKSFTALHDWRL